MAGFDGFTGIDRAMGHEPVNVLEDVNRYPQGVTGPECNYPQGVTGPECNYRKA